MLLIQKLKYNSKQGSAGKQEIYGIIQGGIYKDLREESIDFNQNKIDTFGIAIGGSLRFLKEEMKEVVNFTASKLNNIQTSSFIRNRRSNRYLGIS